MNPTYNNQSMEVMAKSNAYTVYELTSDGLMYTSQFTNKSDAKSFSYKYTHSDSYVYIFKTHCIKILDPSVEGSDSHIETHETHTSHDSQTQTSVVDLNGMFYRKYGKGYLLTPPEDSEHYGEKYFHNGWWMPAHNSWFFKKEHLSFLKDHGAVKATKKCSFAKNTTVESSHDSSDSHGSGGDSPSAPTGRVTRSKSKKQSTSDDVNFDGMFFVDYGKGYLLIPPSYYQHYGEKYFHNGFWMPQRCGWFFKKQYYQWLIDHGAVEETEAVIMPKQDQEQEQEDLSNMAIVDYGKGYLLQTRASDKLYGQKYFLDGFWNERAKGWFFKKSSFQTLVDLGATYIKSELVSAPAPEVYNSDDEYTSNNTTSNTRPTPNFVKYGNSWILKEDDHYVYDHSGGSNKFLSGGYYMGGQEGWVFSTRAKNKFLSSL